MDTNNEQLPLLFVLDSNSFDYSEKQQVYKFLDNYHKMIERDKFNKRICNVVVLWVKDIKKTALDMQLLFGENFPNYIDDNGAYEPIFYFVSDSINSDFLQKVSYINKAMYCIINVGEETDVKEECFVDGDNFIRIYRIRKNKIAEFDTRRLFKRLRRDTHIDYPIEYYRNIPIPIVVDEIDGIFTKELLKDLAGE